MNTCYKLTFNILMNQMKHELHNDYLLAPEKLENNQNMLSNYYSSTANEYCKKNGSVNKLVPDLGIKSKYVFQYKNLQLHLLVRMKFKND